MTDDQLAEVAVKKIIRLLSECVQEHVTSEQRAEKLPAISANVVQVIAHAYSPDPLKRAVSACSGALLFFDAREVPDKDKEEIKIAAQALARALSEVE